MMNDQPKLALLGLMHERGAGLLGDPTLLENLLRERCPQYRPEVTVLLNAHREGIHAILRTELGKTPEANLVQHLQHQLRTNQSMAAEPARYAVDAWLGALRPFAALTPPANQRIGREEFFGSGFTGARAKDTAMDGLVNIAFGIACLLLFVWFANSSVEVADSITASRYQFQMIAVLLLGIGALIRGAFKSIRGFLASQQPAPDALWYVLDDTGLQIFIDDKQPVQKEGFLVPWASMDQLVSGPGGLFVKYRLSPTTPPALADSRIIRADCRARDGALFVGRFPLWYNAMAAGLNGGGK
jgi:hypothetical protein